MLKKKTLFIIILLVFVILNFAFYYVLISKFPNYTDDLGNINVNNLHFFFGRVIDNLIQDNNYYFIHGYHGLNVNYVMGRLPFIPIFLTLIIKFISQNYLIILIIKNIIFFTITFLVISKFFDTKKFLIISFLLFVYNPHNLFTSLSLIPEEGYISYLLIILFLTVYKMSSLKDIYLASFILIIIFLTKASMIYLSYTLSLYLFFKLKKSYNIFYSSIPLIFIFIGYTMWASFGYYKTGKIISPMSISTMSGSTLIVSSNKKFKNYYHLQTPDILESKMWKKHEKNLFINDKMMDEFEINDYFVSESISYILNNKFEFIEVCLKKFHVIFTNIKKDAQVLNSSGYNSLRLSNIPNKIILIISFLIIFRNFILKKYDELDVIFVLTFLSFVFPYIIGWVYTRHIVPVYLVSHFYLFIKLYNLKFNFHK